MQITPLGTVRAMGTVDSAGVKDRLVVAAGSNLYYTDDAYNGTYVDFGNTSEVQTFFTPTPFGLVISNDGSDSCRLWNGISATSIKALGVCISSTVDWDSTYLGDSILVKDTSQAWTPNYWIGYYFRTTVNRQIVDNGYDWLMVYSPTAVDTNWDDSAYTIVATPDSVGSGLGFPRGRATAYYQDRLFVSSAYYKNRIYYSNPRLINDIDPDAIINLDMDAIDEIQWMGVFNGYLIVFGSNSIYAINASLEATPITKAVGCSAPKSIVVGDDYIYFLAQPTGIYRFAGNMYGSLSYKLEKISDPIRETLSSVEAGVLDGACGLYSEKRYWLAYSPDTSLVFDERTSGWYKQGFGFTEALPYTGEFRFQVSDSVYPSADGDTVAWTASAGSDWDCVNDWSTTDYISTATSGAVEKFALADLANYPDGTIVQSLTIKILAKEALSLPFYVYVDVISGGVTYRIGTIDLITSWRTFTFTVDTDPATGLAWTEAGINALQIRFKNSDSSTKYIAGVLIYPVLFGSIPSADFVFASTSKDYIYKYGGVFADDTTSDATFNVSGIVPTATYKTGWIVPGLPIDQYNMRKFWLDKKNDGNISVYIYKNRQTTAVCTLTVTETQDTTHLSWLPPKVSGHEFQLEIKSSADSCQIMGWGALIRNLGERKD
ncbi:hypothetical protein [Candidatus Magnetobacterium casense]|uniref:hypothetical protein n=1 Tax=Candidatus Magnetobacterium casense TaxID=1455061 RepID=UPI001C4442C0|nr:hypothetical protein [Candidatus Magnetobacterium casensis]